MNANRVFVTGMGCLSGLAQGVEATWARLCQGHDAVRAFRRDGPVPNVRVDGVAVWMDEPDKAAFDKRFNARLLEQMDLCSVYAVLAAFEALESANLLDRPDIIHRAGVLVGCGGGGLASACASSAHAIAEATAMIRSGRLDLVIVGGSEAPLTLGSWMAWQGLRVLAKERCRPFSRDRDGMVLGEGGAIFVLESESHALARRAQPLGEILGIGASSDAHHMTHPNGTGAAHAIEAALADARLADARLDRDEPLLISSHGTGTVANDQAEAAALRTVFGAALDQSTVLATKSAHGHLCGAGGALELMIGLRALRDRTAPPVLNFLGPAPDCPVPLALGAPQPISHKILLSNSFAFGGLNSVLVARSC